MDLRDFRRGGGGEVECCSERRGQGRASGVGEVECDV